MMKDNSNEKLVTLDKFTQFQRAVDSNFKEIKIILTEHTDALLSIENTMKFYGDMYKINKEGIEKLDHRVTALENS
jgi:hypothetical protein